MKNGRPQELCRRRVLAGTKVLGFLPRSDNRVFPIFPRLLQATINACAAPLRDRTPQDGVIAAILNNKRDGVSLVVGMYRENQCGVVALWSKETGGFMLALG